MQHIIIEAKEIYVLALILILGILCYSSIYVKKSYLKRFVGWEDVNIVFTEEFNHVVPFPHGVLVLAKIAKTVLWSNLGWDWSFSEVSDVFATISVDTKFIKYGTV